MKKIYLLLFMFCFLLKAGQAQVYSIAGTRGSAEGCVGEAIDCTRSTSQRSAFLDGGPIDFSGELWFDKYGRVLLELQKSSLSKKTYKEISEDGFFDLPTGFRLPEYILADQKLYGKAEEIPPGRYFVVEKERSFLIILGNLQ